MLLCSLMVAQSLNGSAAVVPEDIADKGRRFKTVVKDHARNQYLALPGYREAIRRAAPRILADNVETRAKERAVTELSAIIFQALPHFFPQSELIANDAGRKVMANHYFETAVNEAAAAEKKAHDDKLLAEQEAKKKVQEESPKNRVVVNRLIGPNQPVARNAANRQGGCCFCCFRAQDD